ncbi:MAG: hypothetical protein ACHQ0J_01285 [Candidatus Dormibacterales bacterium]
MTGIPQVDVTHSAAAGQLAIVIHVDVPDSFVEPSGLKAALAAAVEGLVFSKKRQS